MTVKEDLFMKRIELDLIKLKGGIFENTPRKDFFIKHAIGYVESTFELRYREDQARDEHGRFTDEGGSSAGSSDNSGNDLTEHSESVRLDSNGVPFKYPNVKVSKKEYARFMSQVDLKYDTHYLGKEYCHIEFTDKTYLFENRGRGDYNIYRILED